MRSGEWTVTVAGVDLPPPPVLPLPPRPDLGIPAGARHRRAGVVVIAVGAALALVAAALSSPGGSGNDPGRRGTASAPATLSADALGTSRPAFRYWYTSLGGTPYRWDPCRSITYLLQVDEAPAWAERDTAEAFRRLSEATGFSFVSEGTTTEGTPSSTVHEMERERRPDGADVVLVWANHDRFTELRKRYIDGRAIAYAATFFGGVSSFGARHYAGAYVLIDRWAARTRGFEGWWSHGLTLQHELGHVMGLGHVRDRGQLMYDGNRPDLTLEDWGEGDREGLRQLGADGCTDG